MINRYAARRIPIRSAVPAALFLCLLALASARAETLGVPSEPSQSTELRWKFTEGAELVYRMTMYNEMELPQGMGTSVTDLETTQRWEIIEIADNGDATIRLTTDRVRMSMQSPMANMTVDSAEETPPSGTPLDAITAMAGTSYTVVIDATGTLKSLAGLEEMRETLRQAMQDPSIAEILDPMLTDDTLRSQWQQGIYAMPEEAVSIGTTWNRSFTLPVAMLGNMTTDSRYEVEAIDDDIAVIASMGTMSIAESGDRTSPMSMQFTRVDMIGSARFDIGRGLLLHSENTMTMEMSMALGGQEVVMASIATSTLELVEEGR